MTAAKRNGPGLRRADQLQAVPSDHTSIAEE